MLFGKATQDLFGDNDTLDGGDKYDRLRKQDAQNAGEGGHVERIVKSKGRELHHDRRNFKCPDTTT